MTLSTREGEPVTISLADLHVTCDGKYADLGKPAPTWDDGGPSGLGWAAAVVDPAINAVGAHTGPAFLTVSGAAGISISLDAAVTNDGYSSGPLVWLMPSLHHQGKQLAKLCLDPVSLADLYPANLTEDGELLASPHLTYPTMAEFLGDLAPRLCGLLNAHLATLEHWTVTVPAIPFWQKGETIGYLTVKARWDKDGRLPSTTATAERIADKYGLSLRAASTIHDQTIEFGDGLGQFAPGLDQEGPTVAADSAGCFMEVYGPTTALSPAARAYLADIATDPDIDVDITVDGAAIFHP